MLSANAVIVAVALATGASSSLHSASPHSQLASSNATAVNNRTLSSLVARFDGAVTSINWTQIVAGVDGIGGGNDVFRVSVLVDESDVCHLDVACDAAINTDYVVECSEPSFTEGQDVDIRITSMPCLGAPSGFHTTDIVQR